MISSGIDPQTIFNITDASPFDIIAPETTRNHSNSESPYVIISFAADTDESKLAVQNNSQPDQHTQKGSALVVPQFNAIQPQTNYEISMELGLEMGAPDAANSFWWTQFDNCPESYGYSWSKLSFTGAPYNSEPDNSGTWGTENTSGLLDVYTTALSGSYSGTIEPWRTTLDMTEASPESMQVEDWSSEYEWMDSNEDSDEERDTEQDSMQADEECMSECSDNGDDGDTDMSDYDPDDE
jgi:hypothetical protein